MVKLLLSIIALAATVSAYNIFEGSCKRKDLPTEKEFNRGAKEFCDFHWKPTEAKLNPWIELARPNGEILSTHALTAYDGTHLLWVYKFNRVDPTLYTGQSLREYHNYHNRIMKTKEILSENILGLGYCVVDGTEDVLFTEGRAEVPYAQNFYGKFVWESYRRHGDVSDGSPLKGWI